VICALPMNAGGVKVIVACPMPDAAATFVGAPGTPATTVIEKAWVVLPAEFVAVTVPLNVPVVLGAPERTPVTPFSETPPGNAPELSEKVGAGEPLAV
jgi:hypothetical protein